MRRLLLTGLCLLAAAVALRPRRRRVYAVPPRPRLYIVWVRTWGQPWHELEHVETEADGRLSEWLFEAEHAGEPVSTVTMPRGITPQKAREPEPEKERDDDDDAEAA